MTFRTIYRTGLPATQSPFRVVDERECEVEWINRFLDMQCIRGIAPLTLRSYANMLLHFVRWWCRQPGVDGTRFTADQFTEATLVDYVRDQLNEQPKPGPENVNQRSSMLRRLFRFYFHEEMPHGPYRMQRVWFRRSPLGYGRGRAAVAADLTLKVPQRVMVPLSAEQVARFWGSFRTARDLALVALMLLNGLRSREVLALKLEDLLFSETQIRVHGKGARVRLLPLPPETIRLLQCYLKTERPLTNAAAVFVSLKGRARGSPLKPAGAAAPDGPRPHSHHAALHSTDPAGCIRRVYPRRRADRQTGATAAGMRTPPHPFEEALRARVRLLATTLRPATVRQYEHTVRLFMAYLRQSFPEIRRANQLRRDPRVLGWLEYLWTRRVSHSGKPLCAASRAAHLIRLRKLFDLLADHAFPPRPGLLLSEDIPHPDQTLPRPLTPEDDARLQAELLRRNDLLSSALLLTRLTGMRIGETVDLAAGPGGHPLRHLGGEQWALHVPVGKLHNERWTPVDERVRTLIARLRFLRMLPPAAPPEFLLPRPKGRGVLGTQLRAALSDAATQAGITAHIVPHQMRHTYATTMLRAGVSLPALMKLLGHRTANMTLRYVEITQKDLQREFHLARSSPRHLVPMPASVDAPDPDTIGPATVLERFSAAIRVLELYRQQNPTASGRPLQLLLRRLVRARSGFQKVVSLTKIEK